MEVRDLFDMQFEELPVELQKVIESTEEFIGSGYTPSFHLDQRVGPHLNIWVGDEEMQKALGLSDNYPVIEIQFIGVPLERFARLVDVPLWLIQILYLDLNNYISPDFHNGMCSLLQIDSWEAEELRKEGFRMSCMDVDEDEVDAVWNQLDKVTDTHGDFYHSIESKDVEKFITEAKHIIRVQSDCINGVQELPL